MRWTVMATLIGLLVVLCGCPTEVVDDDDSAAADGAPVLRELEVVDDPDNVLVCHVRWTTDEPATSRVEFGHGGELRWFVGDDILVTQHEVRVWGLRPFRSHVLQAVSVDAGGVEGRSQRFGYHTADLPFPRAHFEVTTLREDLVQPGWTAMNMHVGSVFAPTVAVFVDMEGDVVWYHALGPDVTTGDIEVTLQPEQTVLIGGSLAPGYAPLEVDLRGEVVWQGPPQPAAMLATDAFHHTFQRLAEGHYLTMRYDFDSGMLRDVLVELDADGEELWRWRAEDHIPEVQEMHIHGNMVQVDLDADAAWFHSHQLHTLYRIDRASGEVAWELGEDRDFTVVGEHPDPWFKYAHGPEILPDGHLLLYDNGGGDEREYSRVMEYALDEQAMTVEPVWEYPGDLAEDEWYTIAWGDADRLDNRNVLVTAGSLATWDSTSRVFEVTDDGEMAWEMFLTADDGEEPAGSYMSQRIPVLVGEL